MQRISIFIILTLCLFCVSTKAQNPEKIIDNESKLTEPIAKEGTFQFIYYPSKRKYVYSTQTLIKIEKSRDKKETRHIWLNDFVQVKILSKEYIESANFVPLPLTKYID